MRKFILALFLFLIACQSSQPTPALLVPPIRKTPTPISATATPTKTPIVTPTAFPTPSGEECPVHLNEWHPPQNVPCMRHHHGIDPRSDQVKSIFNIDGYNIETMLLDPYGELWQPLWLSSPQEEREGFIWALYHNPSCIQGEAQNSLFDFSEYDCIVDVLVRHHDTGELDHLVKMIHSEVLIVKACDKMPNGQADLSKCGVLQAIRNPHYGRMHASYKKVACDLPGQPQNEFGNPPPLLQANYRTSRTQFSLGEFNVQYWVSVTTDGSLDQYYVNTFNSTITNFAWSAEGWQFWPATSDPKVPDVSFCGTNKVFSEIQNRLMQQPAIPGVEHKTFQLIDLRIVIPEEWTTQTVFWMDIYGNPQPDGTCEEASGYCVPWIKTPNFPGPKVAVNFNAQNLGRCILIPCFIADDFGVQLVPPWMDVP